MPFTQNQFDDLYIVYLHGFLSSPNSLKAQQTVSYCRQIGLADRIHVPELEFGPLQTIAQLSSFIATKQQYRVVLIGSSLGGFYATCLADTLNLPAAVINPAVEPHQYWRNFLGQHKSFYSDKLVTVNKEHIEELNSLHTTQLSHPENFLLLAQKGDEILDYRQAQERYRFSQCIIEEGGNHSFENYEAFLPTIVEFLAIKK